jgi:hypothetical protein
MLCHCKQELLLRLALTALPALPLRLSLLSQGVHRLTEEDQMERTNRMRRALDISFKRTTLPEYDDPVCLRRRSCLLRTTSVFVWMCTS